MEFRTMRRFKQQLDDEQCRQVLQNEKRGTLAVTGDGGWPYALPIDYVFDSETGNIYFHCAKQGHKIDALKNDSRACFTVCEQGQQREDWSYHARSVIVFGNIRLVESDTQAEEYVRRLAHKYYPGSEHEAVEDDIARNLPRLQMLELVPVHITGKSVHEK